MASLKHIADQIADSLNRPFDDMLKERVKVLFRQELAVYIRQQINKYGIDSQFKTRYSITCIKVNPSDSSLDESVPTGECYRSINKVANPVRYITDDPFTYVGDTNGKVPYNYTYLAVAEYNSLMPAIQTSDLITDQILVILPEDVVVGDPGGGTQTLTTFKYVGTLLIKTFTGPYAGLTIVGGADQALFEVEGLSLSLIEAIDPGEYTVIVALEQIGFPPLTVTVNLTVEALEYYDVEDTIILPTTYDYRNGYLYIYPNYRIMDSIPSTIKVMIEGVHSSYDFITDTTRDSKVANLIYLDTVEFPMPDDIIQLVKEKLLATELSIIDDKDKVVSPHIDNN
jgi:hypothetical protein